MDDMQAIKSLLAEVKLRKKPSMIMSDEDRKAKVYATLAQLHRYNHQGIPLRNAQ